MNQSSPKFRPYLTLEQMKRIVLHCQTSLKNTFPSNPNIKQIEELDSSIIEALQLMILKADNNLTRPAFIPIAAKLGIPTPEFKEPDPEEQKYMNGQMSPEEAKAFEVKLMERINHGNS